MSQAAARRLGEVVAEAAKQRLIETFVEGSLFYGSIGSKSTDGCGLLYAAWKVRTCPCEQARIFERRQHPGTNKVSVDDLMKTIQCHTLDILRLPRSGTKITAVALTLAGLGWLLAGCVPTSIYPLFREADLVHDPALMGVWKDKPDGTDRWTFTAGKGKSYTLEIQGESQRAVFVAYLFKLDGERFLDVYPAESALEETLQKNPYGLALVPSHAFFRVRATEPALRMSCMGLDWLKQQLTRDPKALAHVITSDGRVVLTGETEAMQAFIKKHLKDADAWNDMFEGGLTKVPSVSPK
jgi:hypothetical protein